MSERPPFDDSPADIPRDGDVGDDPFLIDDPAAQEREARRREREARRRQRAERDQKRAELNEQRAQERSARDEQRAREKAALDEQREAERRRREEEGRAERDALRQHREAGRREREVAAPGEPPAPPPEPPPALLDEPAPPMEPWAHELGDDAEGPPASAGRSRLARMIPRRPIAWAGILVLALVAWFLIALFQPFAGQGGDPVTVKIAKGSTVSQIGDILDQNGIISSSTLFQIRATLAGRRSDLLAGTYSIPRGSSYSDVLDTLTTPAPERSRAVTIPEALTREQIAKQVAKDGIAGSYAKATEHSNQINLADYGAQGAPNLEGFLFPSTYDLPPHATVDDLVSRQLATFKQNFSKVDLSYARSKNLTAYDVLIIASIIEKEAALSSDQPLVAAVIYNRLHAGMTLGMDSTVRYATGEYDYTQPLTQSELAIDSPYNTRIHTGLPPTPIANPGLSAIKAAANPPNVDYLYFVTKPGACGKLDFASTDAEFQAAQDAYNQARDAAGGKSPVQC